MGAGSLQIRLAGEIGVVRDGNLVPLPQSKKTRALLAYLALNDGPQRRERLCDLFWEIPDDPRGSLRWSLSKLRGIVNDVDADRIQADRNNVCLDRSKLEIDFLALAKAASTLSAASTATLAALAEEFKKGFLDDLALSGQDEYETWRLSQQEHARKYRCLILLEMIARLQDDPSAQADVLYEVVRLEPYDLSVHQQLISALTRAGRKKEATRQRTLSAKELEDVEGFSASLLDTAVAAPAASSAGPSSRDEAREPAPQQTIRFCKSADGVQIAYATVGEGPPLVKTSNWLNHLEFDWESPVWRHIFHAFSDHHQLVRYDARGNGLSDWDTDDFSVERQVEDLEAVVEAAGLDQFPLFGLSQGCAISIEYAARHPEKVTKLILHGGYARGWRTRSSEKFIQETEAMVSLIRSGWGKDYPIFRQMFASLFMPDAPPENHDWFNELQRMTTSPKNAADLLEALGNVDVEDRLRQVKAPTLVIHARGDMRVPFNSGREMAAGIKDARFVALETNNHLIPDSDPVWPRYMEVINAFLAE